MWTSNAGNGAILVSIIMVLVIQQSIEVHGQGRVAPGVPPQHYQQQAPPQQQYHPSAQQQQQQFQQQPQFQQQQQQQFQQAPPQYQQQQQQVHQQAPPQQHHQPEAHHHGHHGQPQQILNAANIQHEKEHIAEHMEVPIDTSKMTDQELQFHYFKMHDADNNNKLDGCELIKSLIHWHGDEEPSNYPTMEDAKLEEVVDPLLKQLDMNFDGFIDYAEFKQSQ